MLHVNSHAQVGPYGHSAGTRSKQKSSRSLTGYQKFTTVAAGDLVKKKLWIWFFLSMITKIKEQVPGSDTLVPGGAI